MTIHDESDLVKDLRHPLRQVHGRKDGNSAVLGEASQMNIQKILVASVVTLTFTAQWAASQADDGGLAFGRSQAPAPLEGTWELTVQPVVCSSGMSVPGVPSVRVYMTFAPGGTLTETNSNVAFEPGQRSPGHGYWDRTGRTSYQFAMEAFIQFDSTLPPYRYKRGYQRMDQTLEMHTLDDFTTTGTVKFFAGTATENPSPSGCASATGVRMF